MSNCFFCNKQVGLEREEFLVASGRKITCIDCSSETKTTGYMDYFHKTAPMLVILPDNDEVKRIAKRAFCRAR